MTFDSRPLHPLAVAALAALSLACPPPAELELGSEPVGSQTFASPQADPIALSADGSHLYVANTTSNSLSVIRTASNQVIAEIAVGLEPVSVAVRPGGAEVWVSNHLSDSVSVVDVAPGSPTENMVVRTIQAFLPEVSPLGAPLPDPMRTDFDEPVGIAFTEDGSKGYVALSSRNDIAVIEDYEVARRIHITAQEPRALAVAGNLLYVIPFESGNRTELSVCPAALAVDDPDCTLLAREVGDFVVEPNLPGRTKHIVVEPDAPDRDLFVIDTTNDTITGTASTIGTLLYDIAVGSSGNVFISLTDARNDVSGLEGDDLDVLENRIFDNQIGVALCDANGNCSVEAPYPLDPVLPAQPNDGTALAMPYGLALSGDENILVGTAASSSRLFTMNAHTGAVLGRLDLGAGGDLGLQIPKGVALRSSGNGAPKTAYVLNTLENTVSVVDVGDPANPTEVAEIAVGNDPTPDAVRRGRIAFTSAFATTGHTFSCESCHPDGNTDQLLWTIGGACFFSAPNGTCSQHDEIRSTMPIRGLDRTLPLHWDGSLGDPFGGPNGAEGPAANLAASCDGDDPQSCFRHLVNASLSGVMCSQPACQAGPTGLPGALTETEREDMATFLWSVKYPPARERAVDDTLSASAMEGMKLFFINQNDGSLGGVGAVGGIMTCGDMDSGCHALPLLAGTNNVTLQGFDAPTLRGLNDRWVQFSIGITGAVDALEAAKLVGQQIPFNGLMLNAPTTPIPYSFDEGFEENVAFAASFAAFTDIYNIPTPSGPLDIFQMLQEMGTGFSGATGRQATISQATTANAPERADTEALLDRLEAADLKGGVSLQVRGHALPSGDARFYAFDADTGQYTSPTGEEMSRSELLDVAAAAGFLGTATAQLPENYGSQAQPLLAPECDAVGVSINQVTPMLPVLPAGNPMRLRGWDVLTESTILVDGQPVDGSVTPVAGDPDCPGPLARAPISLFDGPLVDITLDAVPAAGLHSLQVQSPAGPISNELPICVSFENTPTVKDCL